MTTLKEEKQQLTACEQQRQTLYNELAQAVTDLGDRTLKAAADSMKKKMAVTAVLVLAGIVICFLSLLPGLAVIMAASLTGYCLYVPARAAEEEIRKQKELLTAALAGILQDQG